MNGYTVNRSNRKTLGLYIKGDNVEVRAPLQMPQQDIARFVASKEKWIQDKLAKSAEQRARRKQFCLNYGGAALLLGKEYPISAREGGRMGFDGACFYLPPDLPPAEIQRAMIQLYRAIAKNVLTGKVTVYAKQTGCAPVAVKINGAKTRWGSCSNRDSINFSWRLIMAGDDVVDYVVVHELMHTKEHNHSERFWALVASVLPGYPERQAKLKALGKRLSGEQWA